eukprot:NODE_5704_length_1742_cov_9.209288.p1 GENE.NODE_5704_length_1742_cov_9.209288~~NODE_5704_length_1742_cov_9.209288.p1  ORF type:complete len:415 (-),score=57.94 NODE_5704_length_1742_cov_9.209288:142-1386(-)
MHAFEEGGETAVQTAKRRLFLRPLSPVPADDASSSDMAGKSELEADKATAAAAGPAGVVGNGNTWPVVIEGPSASSSSLGGYRAACTFPSAKVASYDGSRPRKPITVKGPWRIGPGAKRVAESDAEALCSAFAAGGNDSMQGVKAELFKFAEQRADEMRQGRPGTMQQCFVQPSASPAAQEGDGHECMRFTSSELFRKAEQRGQNEQRDQPQEGGALSGGSRTSAAESGYDAALAALPPRDSVEEDDKKLSSESRGFRAKCAFSVPRKVASLEVGVGAEHSVFINGPWRLRRSEAEADIADLRAAFKEGGLSRANARRMEMRRADMAGPPAEVVEPSRQLTQDAMEERYGKGFAMLAGMGFTVGTGLGRVGQGRTVPVGVSTSSAAATATNVGRQHIGLGFSANLSQNSVDAAT